VVVVVVVVVVAAATTTKTTKEPSVTCLYLQAKEDAVAQSVQWLRSGRSSNGDLILLTLYI
jgi:hypothetical protein